jgi:tryptophan halogenase
MDKKINSIWVVGGGTAGCSVACVLKKTFPNKDIRIIEGRDIPTVGVGESTLGQINNFLQFLDIQDKDFMKECDASYKLSIRFENWKTPNSGAFHYPFGNPYYDQIIHNYNYWSYKKFIYPNTPSSDFADCMYPHMALINQNKINDAEKAFPNWNMKQHVAYHFDAQKLGEFLKKKFRSLGGRILVENIVEVNQNEDGSVKSLLLDTGNIIKGDLYIDCTGFKSLLLDKTLKEPFESYEDILPNNSAIATKQPYTNKKEQLKGYTNCKAVGHGWIWNIPLWSRMGTGYVYSNKYISYEDALKDFQKEIGTDELEFKKLSMRIGIHKRLWVKNVCAIGLSAGFIEPLESNGLLTIHNFLFNLIPILKKEIPNEFAIKHFNLACRRMFRGFAEFVAMHYALSDRVDTEYWRDIQKRHYPIEERFFDDKSDFQLAFRNKMEDNYFHPSGGFPCIAMGMDWHPTTLENIQHAECNSDIESYKKEYKIFADHLDNRKKHFEKIADYSPTLYDYLNENIYNDK